MTLEPSQGQSDALEMVEDFRDSEATVAVLTGFAGTGKTTTLRIIADRQGQDEMSILCPTGKATLRVTEATGLSASTIHRFLYQAQTDHKTGAPIFTLRDPYSFSDYRDCLVVVDEASMISRSVWDDLKAVATVAGFKLLLVGDTFQLPPVSKDQDDFNALEIDTPFRAHLDQVIRQAVGSPIIRASMLLRKQRPEREALSLLSPLGASSLIPYLVEAKGRGVVVICHTNARRHWINSAVRAALGYQPNTIHTGEPLLVLQNNYTLDRYNGEVVTFDKWDREPTEEWRTKAADRFSGATMEMSFGVGTVEGQRTMVALEEISGEAERNKISTWTVARHSKWTYQGATGALDNPPPHLHANYGYGLTCHKSQGSEWPEVLIILEDSVYRMRPLEKYRWLYTATTRAQTTVRYVYLPDPAY